MRVLAYASVCDGIGAVHVAWQPLGYRCVWTSEIEPFPAAVVEHHWHLPNLGDMTKITEADIERHDPIDLLVGGTPCQSFSVAGLRKGLADPRGNLALRFLQLAGATRARWLVWENVPGVLSSGGGRDFGTFLGSLVELGYGFAYRVLDAIHFGCAFPRPRVFVLAYRGDWRPAVAALFERASLAGDQAGNTPQEEKKTGSAAVLTSRGGMAHDDRSNYVLDDYGIRMSTPLEWERALGFPDNYTAIYWRRKNANEKPNERAEAAMEPCGQIQTQAGRSKGDLREAGREVRNLRVRPTPGSGVHRSLPRNGKGKGSAVSPLQHQVANRGGYMLHYAGVGIPGRERIAADGPRYKALGNSMAVPVMRWIGRRIIEVEKL